MSLHLRYIKDFENNDNNKVFTYQLNFQMLLLLYLLLDI